jgi:hypothetical protein
MSFEHPVAEHGESCPAPVPPAPFAQDGKSPVDGAVRGAGRSRLVMGVKRLQAARCHVRFPKDEIDIVEGRRRHDWLAMWQF